MIDWKTVMSWLEGLTQDDWPEWHSDSEVQETAKAALELLKEQEWKSKRLTPTEPTVSINAYGVKFYYCPHCARPIIKSASIGSPRHCEDCGQAVKWDV